MTYTAIDPKTMQRLFMSNPFMSQWLSLANTMAGTVRGFWTAELSRMQAAGFDAFNREAMRFWSAAWTMPSTKGASGPAAAVTEMVEAAGEVTERAVRRAMPVHQASVMRSATPRARAAKAKPATRKPAAAKRTPKRR
ncbi:hypothetical protein [Elioraea sp.]|uniref:hypothetical protein n=1 Tax=Elioraea sp. TaxID=2185103 RepID=UPI0025C736FC|nr:hypothetical protein [Elioraea sp.]